MKYYHVVFLCIFIYAYFISYYILSAEKRINSTPFCVRACTRMCVCVCVVLISDPWDDDLIASLLAGLRTPLTSYPNLSTWSCGIPAITPKLTVQMGENITLSLSRSHTHTLTLLPLLHINII